MTKKVTFQIDAAIAAGADAGILLGDFNNWLHEEGISLKKQKDGALKATVSLEVGKTYQYRYLLNDGRWVNDGNANGYAFISEYGVDNCVIFVEGEAPKAAVAVAPVAPEVVEAPAKKAPKAKAAAAKVAEPTSPDDLTIIEGIGAKIAVLLQEGGITTFKELSKASQKKLKGILDAAGSRFKMHDPTTWPTQAKLAASGKMVELKALQAELKAGK